MQYCWLDPPRPQQSRQHDGKSKWFTTFLAATIIGSLGQLNLLLRDLPWEIYFQNYKRCLRRSGGKALPQHSFLLLYSEHGNDLVQPGNRKKNKQVCISPHVHPCHISVHLVALTTYLQTINSVSTGLDSDPDAPPPIRSSFICLFELMRLR